MSKDLFPFQQKLADEEAVQEYSEKYGPLQADQVNCKDYWTWVETPWPWER